MERVVDSYRNGNSRERCFVIHFLRINGCDGPSLDPRRSRRSSTWLFPCIADLVCFHGALKQSDNSADSHFALVVEVSGTSKNTPTICSSIIRLSGSEDTFFAISKCIQACRGQTGSFVMDHGHNCPYFGRVSLFRVSYIRLLMVCLG